MHNNILDTPSFGEQPKVEEPKIRQLWIWVLDLFVLLYTLVLFIGAFIIIEYLLFGSANWIGFWGSLFLVPVIIFFTGVFGGSLLYFWYQWFEVSNRYDKTKNRKLLMRFYKKAQAIYPIFIAPTLLDRSFG